jgi:hypothetical protein
VQDPNSALLEKEERGMTNEETRQVPEDDVEGHVLPETNAETTADAQDDESDVEGHVLPETNAETTADAQDDEPDVEGHVLPETNAETVTE